MGKIPEFTRSAPPSSVQADNGGEYIGQGIQKLGRDLMEIGERQRRAQELSYLSSQSIELETRATQKFFDWQKEHSSDPLQKERFLQEAIQQDVDELGQKAPSDDARASFQRMGDDIKRRMSVNGTQWANQQLVKNIGDDIDRSSQTLQLESYRAADPNRIEDIFKQHDTLLVAASSALSSEAVDNIRNVGRREIVSSALEGMIERERLGPAKRLLDSKKYDEVLGAERSQRAYEMINRKAEAIRDRRDKILALRFKDPWKFLGAMGETRNLSQLALTGENPEAVTNSFHQREVFVNDMAKKYGINLPFVSPMEVDAFTNLFTNTGPREAAMIMNNLDDKTTDKQRVLFGRQVFEKEPSLGVALMVSGDAPADAAKVVSGMSLLRRGEAGKAINAPSEDQIGSEFDAQVGEAIEDASLRQALKQAATAHMVKSKFDRGENDMKVISSRDFKESLTALIGPVAHVNGRKTLSFRGSNGSFLDEDDLGDLVDSVTDSEVEKVQGDVPRTMSGEPLNLSRSRGRLTYKVVGDGTYWLFTDQGVAVDKFGQPFQLNLKAIEKLRSGKPEEPGLIKRIFGDDE